jgi:hypothetical protein
MHILIAQRGVEWLGGKAGEYWHALLEHVMKASNYPDYFAAGENSNAEHLHAEPQWKDYNLIPNEEGICEYLRFDPLELRRTYPDIINHWGAEIVKAVRAGENIKAAKFAGCLSHLIGDSGQAAHVFDDSLLIKLLPPGNKRFILHSAIEKVSGRIEGEYTPAMLAGSLKEFNWRMLVELEMLKRRETAEVVPIVQAVLADNDVEAEASASRTATHCAELFADALYTLWAIAVDDVKDLPDEFDLKVLEPVAHFCDMMFNFEPMIDLIPGKSIDNPLPLDPGVNKVIPGICLLANMAPHYTGTRETFVEYSIPAGVFKYFETVIGLNKFSKNQTEAIFKIELDGECVFQSEPLGQESSGLGLKLPLGNASTIRLSARDVRQAPCDTKFFYPVFGVPRLSGRC